MRSGPKDFSISVLRSTANLSGHEDFRNPVLSTLKRYYMSSNLFHALKLKDYIIYLIICVRVYMYLYIYIYAYIYIYLYMVQFPFMPYTDAMKFIFVFSSNLYIGTPSVQKIRKHRNLCSS